MKKTILIIVLAIFASVLKAPRVSAQAAPTPTTDPTTLASPTPLPTDTPVPTAVPTSQPTTAPTDIPQPTATAVPEPTPTMVLPIGGAAPTPIATAAASISPTAMPSATPTPQPAAAPAATTNNPPSETSSSAGSDQKTPPVQKQLEETVKAVPQVLGKIFKKIAPPQLRSFTDEQKNANFYNQQLISAATSKRLNLFGIVLLSTGVILYVWSNNLVSVLLEKRSQRMARFANSTQTTSIIRRLEKFGHIN